MTGVPGYFVWSIGLTAGLAWHYRKNAIGANPRYNDKEIESYPHYHSVVGHGPWILLHLLELETLLVHLYNSHKTNLPYMISLPFKPTFILISDPQSLQHVLSTNFDKYQKSKMTRPYLTEVFGNGIFNSDGDLWYWQRKLASKVFTARAFKYNFETVFRDNINLLLNVLNERALSKTPIDMHDLFYRFFMDSFGRIAFGVDLGSLSYKELPFVSAFDRAQKEMAEMQISVYKYARNFFEGQYKRDVRTIRQFGMNVVQARRDKVKSEKQDNDLLSLFMEYRTAEGVELTNEQLVDQVINFIIAGRDTTAQALSWTLYELATHPECVQKILEESRELGVTGEMEILTYEHVKKMKYAKAVFNEALRLHPSVRRDGKECMENDTLPNGLNIKKGTNVIWSNYAMGRSNNIWDDAATFDPERWLTGKTYSQYEYPVFNAGPRICLGKSLAELQGVLVLVSILNRFDLQIIDVTGVDFVYSLTNPMKDGLLTSVAIRGAI